ncbi:hypothetical protein EX30DRAFT_343477 [Ascodesmis nigricans]|uniref:Uncharacterized protein n=1 Tax=Ascodesmis nigricans TaxID=341454 RepID=A0A4S2MRV2_9PEZI|nr:hypothetical protein EX30DRAFT_343477 [Ascodesmis nigricans]
MASHHHHHDLCSPTLNTTNLHRVDPIVTRNTQKPTQTASFHPRPADLIAIARKRDFVNSPGVRLLPVFHA